MKMPENMIDTMPEYWKNSAIRYDSHGIRNIIIISLCRKRLSRIFSWEARARVLWLGRSKLSAGSACSVTERLTEVSTTRSKEDYLF